MAGQLLQHKPQAKVVFLATTVALAQQQAGMLRYTVRVLAYIYR